MNGLRFKGKLNYLSKKDYIIETEANNSHMSHPNVIQYLGIYTDPKGNKFIITDYMNKGSLLDVLQKENLNLKQKTDM